MVTIEKSDGNFIFRVQGLHKLWAFKSELIIPAKNVVRAHAQMDSVSGWKGWRMPGTHLPSVITAGTFHLDGSKIFWDVMDRDKSIIVELQDEEYRQLIIEVGDTAEAIGLLNTK